MTISTIDPYLIAGERRCLGLVINPHRREITRRTLKPRGLIWALGLKPLRLSIYRNDDRPRPILLTQSRDIAPGFDFTLTVYLPFARLGDRFMHSFLLPFAIVGRPDATGKWTHRVFNLF